MKKAKKQKPFMERARERRQKRISGRQAWERMGEVWALMQSAQAAIDVAEEMAAPAIKDMEQCRHEQEKERVRRLQEPATK